MIKRSYISLKEWAIINGLGYFEAHYKYRLGFIKNAQKRGGRILIKL